MPEDLWPEILSRLPVKSLLRFRCISKSCLSMINDPDFCRLHMENFKDNRNETHLLVVEGIKRSCVLRCSNTFKPIAGALYTLGQSWEEESWEVECSIDGLVLLKSCNREISGFCKLRVWNPSIRKFHDIPSLPEIEASTDSSFTDVEIGLGYDPFSRDYKNVKFIFVNDNIIHSVAVYTLGAHSWKTIPFQGKGCSNWRSMEIYESETVYLRGSLYFTAFDAGRKVVELVSIDLSTELFSSTNLPGDVITGGKYLDDALTLVDDRCTLAWFDFEQGDLWVLYSSSAESEPAYWTRRYSFRLKDPLFLYHKKNGDVLMLLVVTKSFRLPGGTKLLEYVGVVSAYNLETEEERILQLHQIDTDAEIHNVRGYVESLNLLV